MSENPYQPPTRQTSATDTVSKPPWYDTPTRDWERTASTCWLAGVVILLFVGFLPVPQAQVAKWTVLPVIPGPQIYGVTAYVVQSLLLATLPAAICTSLHIAAMQVSQRPRYRRILTLVALLASVAIAIAAGIASRMLLFQ